MVSWVSLQLVEICDLSEPEAGEELIIVLRLTPRQSTVLNGSGTCAARHGFPAPFRFIPG